MQDRHRNRKQYFTEQGITTKKYVIPYIEEVKSITNKTRVLEIGCGEGGNLIPFIERGCEVVGIDLNDKKIENAKIFMGELYPEMNIDFRKQNIYDVTNDDIGAFDLVLLRDVIEHIPNQEKFLDHLKSFLNKEGVIFFGFPPWCMPFGGHQQICNSKVLKMLPYYHLLPKFVYKGILKLFGEKENTIVSLLEIKDTRIGINRFQKIIKTNELHFAKKTFYLINPNYEIKFGLKPRVQFPIIKSIPYLRDFFTTCYYCVVRL